MTDSMKKKFTKVILAKIDEAEKRGYDYLTDSDVMDILEECQRQKIPYTRDDLIACGLRGELNDI